MTFRAQKEEREIRRRKSGERESGGQRERREKLKSLKSESDRLFQHKIFEKLSRSDSRRNQSPEFISGRIMVDLRRLTEE